MSVLDSSIDKIMSVLTKKAPTESVQAAMPTFHLPSAGPLQAVREQEESRLEETRLGY